MRPGGFQILRLAGSHLRQHIQVLPIETVPRMRIGLCASRARFRLSSGISNSFRLTRNDQKYFHFGRRAVAIRGAESPLLQRTH